MKKGKKNQFLWAVFFLGILLLNFPFLLVYNHAEKVLGIPILFLTIFGLWLLLIVLVYWIIHRSRQEERD